MAERLKHDEYERECAEADAFASAMMNGATVAAAVHASRKVGREFQAMRPTPAIAPRDDVGGEQ
jgi:hypothetical protein